MQEQLNQAGDCIARHGGEEFAVVLPNRDIPGALAVAEDLRFNVEELRINHAGSEISRHVTISLGAASIIPKQNAKQEKLIQLADRALYMAKKKGCNRIMTLSGMGKN